MFGKNTYWWGGLLIFFLFCSLNLVVFLLRNQPRISYAIAYCIAAYLLVHKVLNYIYWQCIGYHLYIPVEFSAISYLLFGTFITFRLKKVDGFAVFAAILAGMIYSIFFVVSPDSYVSEYLYDTTGTNGTLSFSFAIINHHLLYLGGMLMLCNVRKFSYKNVWQYVIGVFAMVGYSWLIHTQTQYSAHYGKPLIIQITDASVISWLFEKTSTAGVIVYYVCAISAVVLLIVAHYVLNALLVKRRVKKGLPENYFPDSLREVFRPKA